MRTAPYDNLVANLRMLRVMTGISVTELAHQSGVGRRMIYNILNGERGATIETVEKLAAAFRLTGWQLIMPNLQYDLATSGKLDELIHLYTASTEKGRKTIEDVAEQAPKKAS